MEKKILVVDDEELIRELLENVFTRAGYAVRSASSAEEALSILQEEPHWVLFLDLKLPGMSGVELCRKIRGEYPRAVPFAITGNASLFELDECREAGFEDYLTKPVPISVLLDTAARAFEKLERWKNN
jgi:CheY-like chemotaxis protein